MSEIIAESKSDEVPSLLGLHYPVAQLGNFAQALGYQNVARNIVDIQAPSTKWWTIEPSNDPVLRSCLFAVNWMTITLI